jgi:hypothetical protein
MPFVPGKHVITILKKFELFFVIAMQGIASLVKILSMILNDRV